MFALVAGAYAQHPDATAEVLRSDSVVGPDSYTYDYKTSNGIEGKAAGQLKTINNEMGIVSQGEFGWTSPEGEQIRMTYVADENGTFIHNQLNPILISRSLKKN